MSTAALEAGIRTRTDSWPAIPTSGLLLEGKGVLHPPARRVKPSNPRIFRMPPKTLFLVNQGKEKARKGLEIGLGLKTNSHPLPPLWSVGRKLSPRILNPNHLGSPPLQLLSTPRTPRPPPPHKCRINSDIQGPKRRMEWLSRISPFCR